MDRRRFRGTCTWVAGIVAAASAVAPALAVAEEVTARRVLRALPMTDEPVAEPAKHIVTAYQAAQWADADVCDDFYRRNRIRRTWNEIHAVMKLYEARTGADTPLELFMIEGDGCLDGQTFGPSLNIARRSVAAARKALK
jgi:hypothetical protein